MVSPTHVPFEGTSKDRKSMSGHSVATWRGKDIPYVTADFSKVRAAKYQKHPAASHKVMGMWVAYYEAYQDREREQKAWLHVEKSNARILLIAGGADEAWPAGYSVNMLREYLKRKNYPFDFKAIVYRDVSHLTGMMPSRERGKSYIECFLSSDLCIKASVNIKKKMYGGICKIGGGDHKLAELPCKQGW